MASLVFDELAQVHDAGRDKQSYHRQQHQYP
jgi:hypothetical protein